MDFFQAQEFFAKIYPGKQITYEFDDNCHRTVELVFTDGLPNLIHHVECNKVCVKVEGMDTAYVPILPHRFNTSWKAAKEYVNAKKDVHLNEEDISVCKELRKTDPESYQSKVMDLCEFSGLSSEEIESKLS